MKLFPCQRTQPHQMWENRSQCQCWRLPHWDPLGEEVNLFPSCHEYSTHHARERAALGNSAKEGNGGFRPIADMSSGKRRKCLYWGFQKVQQNSWNQGIRHSTGWEPKDSAIMGLMVMILIESDQLIMSYTAHRLKITHQFFQITLVKAN